MSTFIGDSASLKDNVYDLDRLRMSQESFKYLQKHNVPATCPSELPYTCGFQDGYSNVSPATLRIGGGLTHCKGKQCASTQLVGPVASQQHNGNRYHTNVGTGLRTGSSHVRRGAQTSSYDPSAWVQGHPHGIDAQIEPFMRGGQSTRFECDF
jgi:hypothetical protein